jgi:hypothetical protein
MSDESNVIKLLGKDNIKDLDKFIVTIGTLETDQERFESKKKRASPTMRFAGDSTGHENTIKSYTR